MQETQKRIYTKNWRQVPKQILGKNEKQLNKF